MYDTIFNQEFNISFFKPRKDLCIICKAYKNNSGSDIDNVTENYNIHQKEKENDISEESNIVVLTCKRF